MKPWMIPWIPHLNKWMKLLQKSSAISLRSYHLLPRTRRDGSIFWNPKTTKLRDPFRFTIRSLNSSRRGNVRNKSKTLSKRRIRKTNNGSKAKTIKERKMSRTKKNQNKNQWKLLYHKERKHLKTRKMIRRKAKK